MLLYSNPIKKIGVFAFLFLLFFAKSFSQLSSVISVHGTNVSSVDCGGIVFSTPTNMYHKTEGAGSAWVKSQIDLSQSFEIRFVTEIINHPNAVVDGGAFVLQQDTNGISTSTFGLGFRGISPSIAITFDTYMNPEDNDPAFDHIGIQANGNTRSTTTPITW